MTQSVKFAISELSESNAHMNAILHEMFGGVIGINLRNEIFLINPIAEKILNLSYNDVQNKVYSSIELPSLILQSIDEVKEKQHETKHRITLGNDLHLIVQNAPIRKLSGELIGYVVVLFDITEKTKLSQLQREFFTNVSHEIRTPLTSIQGFVETLSNYEMLSTENVQSIVEIMDKETIRLNGLINKMLEIANLEKKEPETLKLEPVNLLNSVNTVFSSYTHNAENKNIKYSMSTIDPSINVLLNQSRFETVLSNLISNAIKYTKPTGTVHVKWNTNNGYGVLSVSDSGIGISSKDQEKVYQRFFRCDPSRNYNIPGYGLGLHISKTLCDTMNLTLDLESEIDVGSTFSIQNIAIVDTPLK